MKKTLRKLTLSRETLRALNNDGLRHAAGGITALNCPLSADTQCTGPNSCECTYGCTEVRCSKAC